MKKSKNTEVSDTGVRPTRQHPPIWNMVCHCLRAVKGRGGSSRVAILRFLMEHYQVGVTPQFQSLYRRCLAKAAADGRLIQIKSSFKLSSSTKAILSKSNSENNKKRAHTISKTNKVSKSKPRQKTAKVTKQLKSPSTPAKTVEASESSKSHLSNTYKIKKTIPDTGSTKKKAVKKNAASTSGKAKNTKATKKPASKKQPKSTPLSKTKVKVNNKTRRK